MIPRDSITNKLRGRSHKPVRIPCGKQRLGIYCTDGDCSTLISRRADKGGSNPLKPINIKM